MNIIGTVKWFDDKKGFGFILHPDGDVFVHYSAIEIDGYKTLAEGDKVEYELVRSEKGLSALHGTVKPLLNYKCSSCSNVFDASADRTCPKCIV